MNTVLVACKTLEDELALAMEKTGVEYPIVWIESGLHNTPKKLNARLSETLQAVDADRVILVMGFCGNALEGICADNFELIVPRVDDCITLLLGSAEARAMAAKEYAAYFLTEGWLRGERSVWAEYLYAVEKYGEEEAQSIAQTMLGHYRTLGLLDSGATSIEKFVDETRVIAETLNLEQKIVPATISYIEELLTGPWPYVRFIVKAPGEAITVSELYT